MQTQAQSSTLPAEQPKKRGNWRKAPLRPDVKTEDLVRAFEAGDSRTRIGEKFKINRTTVNRRLKGVGCKLPDYNFEISKRLPWDEIEMGYGSGQTLRELAERYHVVPSTIHAELRKRKTMRSHSTIMKKRHVESKRKLAEAERLKNVEGLDLKMTLRISLAAHLWLEGAQSLYDMKADIYPDSNDPFNATKQLDRRFHAVIEDEKQRITKLSDEQRRTEAEHLRARLSKEIAKPKKTPKK